MWLTCASLLIHFVGPDLEGLQGIRAEGVADGHVGGVAAAGDQYAPDARNVVARVEGVPVAVEISFEPAGKIHRPVGRRRAHVAEIASAVTRGDVHAPAKGDRQVCEVTAYAGPFMECIPGRLAR